MLTTIKNNPQVQLVPMLLRKHPFQIRLRLLDIPTSRQLPTLRQPMNMGIDRKRRLTPRLAHDHRRRLVPHPGQFLQLGKSPRHQPAMSLQ